MSTVDLAGVPLDACVPGAALTARMVDASGTRAFATTDSGLALRWCLGFALILACGLLMLWITGAARFGGWRWLVSVVVSLGAPLAVLAGILAATY